MASIGKDQHGAIRILFFDAHGRRRSIRPGKINSKLANELKLKIEHLNALVSAQLPMDSDTARWVAHIGDDLAHKLAQVGLIPARQSTRLGPFLEQYLQQRQLNSKPNTLANLQQVAKHLLQLYGANTALSSITPQEAQRLKTHYWQRGLAPATIHRQLKFAKHFFAIACQQQRLSRNPFDNVKASNSINHQRQAYVSVSTLQPLLEQAPAPWRLLLALCRFAGLRCPSEVLSLRWDQIDFSHNRMTVHSSKTEHLPGKASRIVPLFARLRPYIDEARTDAQADAVYVISWWSEQQHQQAAQRGWKGMNLRTGLMRLLRSAGIAPWPKLFHNLRASCETDLMQQHPIHVVTAWLGNTPQIAITHYLQTQESDFAKAIAGPTGGSPGGSVLSAGGTPRGTVSSGQDKTGEEATTTKG